MTRKKIIDGMMREQAEREAELEALRAAGVEQAEEISAWETVLICKGCGGSCIDLAPAAHPMAEHCPDCNGTGLDNGLAKVLREVAAERKAQDARWGDQGGLPDGTGGPLEADIAACARDMCESAASNGACTWRLILSEEFAEAIAENDPERLREELIQVAAVAVAWVEAINRRGSR